jgi:hypothetical protein
MSNFKIGDIAIGQNFTVDVECNGKECIVLSEYKTHVVHDDVHFLRPVEGYFVEWENGNRGVVEPHKLRKKYDGDEITDWENCVWKPMEELA